MTPPAPGSHPQQAASKRVETYLGKAVFDWVPITGGRRHLTINFADAKDATSFLMACRQSRLKLFDHHGQNRIVWRGNYKFYEIECNEAEGQRIMDYAAATKSLAHKLPGETVEQVKTRVEKETRRPQKPVGGAPVQGSLWER